MVLKLVLCQTGLLLETGWILGEGLGLHSYAPYRGTKMLCICSLSSACGLQCDLLHSGQLVVLYIHGLF